MRNKYVNSYVFNKLKQIPFIETDDGYFTPRLAKLEPILKKLQKTIKRSMKKFVINYMN